MTAIDAVDGNISGAAVIVSNVDTSQPGNYTVTYTVTNSLGQSSSATRQVRVIGPETRPIPGSLYNFAPKGKQGATFTYSATVAAQGTVSLTVSIPNKSAATVTIKNPQGNVVFTEKFAANATRTFPASPGAHSVGVSIDEANGNTTIGLTLTTPSGTETYFPLPEIPL